MLDHAALIRLSKASALPLDFTTYERDDEARTDVLRSYDILDTEPEAAFDRIVELAQVLFNAPIALLSFIDSKRQWTKASAGIDARGNLPREFAFCDHTIRQAGVTVVPDAREDSRFADLPSVTGAPHIRFYAGAPLITPEGARIGSICIVSPDARAELGEDDRQRLQALAGIASNELELRRKTAQANLLTQEIEHRVKTTLHFVTRILEAQAARIEDRQVRRHLLQAVDRIGGIEVLQRHLRHGGDVFEGDARDYLLSLVMSLQETILEDSHQRAVSVRCSDTIAMSSDGMATLGMVVVELVTNALKHGRGAVDVHAVSADDAILVTVSDEGHGVTAEHLALSIRNKTGLQLVSMLASRDGVLLDPTHPQQITIRLAA